MPGIPTPIPKGGARHRRATTPNARKESKKIELSSQARHALKEYLAADYKLYNHFKTQFSNKLRQFGKKRMETELSVLRRANEDMKTRCGIQARDNDKVTGDNKLWGQGMVAYTAQEQSDTQCQLFAMSELSFIDHLRDIQSERAGQLAGYLNIDLGQTYEDSIQAQMKRLPNIRNGVIDIERLKATFIHSK